MHLNAAKWDETLHALREDGLYVRIKHLRRFKLRRRALILDTIGGFRRTDSEDIRVSELFEVDPKGGITVCQIVTSAPEPRLVVEAKVKCSKRDHYNKRTGRTKALGAALHMLYSGRHLDQPSNSAALPT